MMCMLARLAEHAKANKYCSIDTAVSYLVQRQILADVSRSPDTYARACTLVFVSMSWISMLYSPSPTMPVSTTLSLDEQQFVGLNLAAIGLEQGKKPLCEMLRQFGQLLPIQNQSTNQTNWDPAYRPSDTLQVSLLNASTLWRIGRIEIQWVSNISSHLSFDIEKRRLLMFQLPSYCVINRFEKTLLDSLLSSYYDAYSKPDGFSTKALLEEIRLSYSLVFGDDRRAREHFRRVVAKRAIVSGNIDICLRDLVKQSADTSSRTTAYSIHTNFPILGPRLLLLQEYISRQDPGTIKMLWQDRRDLLRWYTFWIVTIFGGVGLLFALGQFVLQAIQVSQVA
ncbi:hypothetical protein EJ05DRAFT_315466 [Pseudovirgaria hyperparasitica]|uniref:Uncharacterized protein n=1 Tax=Pseudovirgaria hyperparasitica TaxID=470096 RepID=A0A6A6WAQ0_9PEZI|nr:uncharacterized protein EJ05DRAFT_315466 [Pseudovirgaria hyperparasitica]KAF2759932.1 hypothetical protein EJ05DRAFT_315466 [Pseudovirgaria hyperparasitica]